MRHLLLNPISSKYYCSWPLTNCLVETTRKGSDKKLKQRSWKTRSGSSTSSSISFHKGIFCRFPFLFYFNGGERWWWWWWLAWNPSSAPETQIRGPRPPPVDGESRDTWSSISSPFIFSFFSTSCNIPESLCFFHWFFICFPLCVFEK